MCERKLTWQDLTFAKNAVIEASAGTGKTYTLEHIVEKLVTREEDPYDIREILLVTFTEKAAGELKDRIRKILEKSDRTQHIDEATICTIHSFCQQVLSDYPFESGANMGVEIGGSDEEICTRAVHSVLTASAFQSAHEGDFDELMRCWGEDKTTDDLSSDAASRLKTLVENDDTGTFNVNEINSLVAAIRSKISELPGWSNGGPGAYVLTHTGGGSTLSSNKKCNEAKKGYFTAVDGCLQTINNADAKPSELMGALQCVARGKMDFVLNQWDGVPVKEQFNKHGNLSKFSDVQVLAESCVSALRESLVRDLAIRAYPEFVRLKSRTNALTFDDLVREMARLVDMATGDNATEAQRRFVVCMRNRYRVALVDEFQDTDALQWKIFEKLFACIGHLIVVGDPKQAIYGWRGADLATYQEAKSKIEKDGGQVVQLDTMYRSTREMVDDFNTMFLSGWFNGMSEGGRPISYESVLFPKTGIPQKVKDFGNYPNGENAVEWLETGCELKQFVENAANEMIRLHEDPFWQAYMSWERMCVLVRSHADGEMVRNELRLKNIPCRIYKEAGIFSSEETESVLALFDYLSMPRSVGNLSALLLTPLFGVSPDCLASRLATGDARFDRLSERWRELSGRRDWIGLFESILRETSARNLPGVYRQIFDVLIEEYGRATTLTELAAALRGLRSRDSIPGDDGNVRNRTDEGPAVQIMTMHVSKGLEFNAVFVAAGFSGFKKIREINEQKRLFYVALTRAAFKLYLPWSMNAASEGLGKNGSALKTYLGTAILALCNGDVMSRFRNPGPRELQVRNDDKIHTLVSRPPHLGMKGWRFKWDSFSSLNHHSVEKPIVVDAVEDKDDEVKDETPMLVKTLVPKGHLSGTVFHEVMEILCNNDKGRGETDFSIGEMDDFDQMLAETEGRKLSLLEIVRRRLKANGVANRMSEDGKESTARSLARMAWNALRTPLNFGDGEFRLCEITHGDRKAEVDFVLDEGLILDHAKDREGALNGSIDLLLRRGDDYYIVDWKTNALESYDEGAVEAAMEHAGYHLQYKIYAMAAEKWLGSAVVKGAAYLFVRGGEYECKSSGRFVHPLSDEERTEFASTFAGRVTANDTDENEEVKR